MSEDRAIDQALDEIDRWGERLSEQISSLSPQEVVEYFKRHSRDSSNEPG
jgi:hypothetical protein